MASYTYFNTTGEGGLIAVDLETYAGNDQKCLLCLFLSLPFLLPFLGIVVDCHNALATLCSPFNTLPICRECLGEAHEPCDCQMWRNWLQKVTEMKPEECKSVFVLLVF